MTSDILLTMFNLYATSTSFWLSPVPPQSLDLRMMYSDEFGTPEKHLSKWLQNKEKAKQGLRTASQSLSKIQALLKKKILAG